MNKVQQAAKMMSAKFHAAQTADDCNHAVEDVTECLELDDAESLEACIMAEHEAFSHGYECRDEYAYYGEG